MGFLEILFGWFAVNKITKSISKCGKALEELDEESLEELFEEEME